MTFAAAGFLLATIAAVIPVILHLIKRQQAKLLPFPTLRFLRLSVEKTRRRRRLEDLLLMLLRMAVLIFIAVGLAKPTLTSLASLLGGEANSAVAIVLDNSASMSVIDQGRTRLETALGAANQILDQLRAGDRIALFVTCGPQFPETGKFDRTHEKVREILDQVQPSFERADLAEAILAARKLLLRADAPNRQLFVISDFQRSSWAELEPAEASGSSMPAGSAASSPENAADAQGRQPLGGQQNPALADSTKTEADTGAASAARGGAGAGGGNQESFSEEELRQLRQIPLILVDCHRTPKPNVAIVGVETLAAVPVAHVPIYTTVELFNAAGVPDQRHIELYLNGSKAYESPAIPMPPGEKTRYPFRFAFTTGGLHQGEIRLAGEDGSEADNRWFFTMEVDQGIPVALVSNEKHEIPFLDDGFYLENALRAAGGGVRLTHLLGSQLAGEPLERYKVLFCVNLEAPTGEALNRLHRFVSTGGALVWVCGDNVEPGAYNNMNEQAEGLLIPGVLATIRSARGGQDRDSWRVTWLDREHRALSLLAEPASLYQSILVYRHVQVMPEGVLGAKVLARLDDGEPILLGRAAGRGTVVFWGTSTHVGWTNLPLRPIFLPLIARLTFELAGTEERRYQALAGNPLVVPFDEQIPPRVAEIVPPGGAVIRQELKAPPDAPLREFRYSDTHQIGVYMVRLLEGASPKQVAISVNTHPEEARDEKLGRDVLEKLYSPSPLIWADNPEDLSSTFKYLREGTSLWGLFLTAVLLGLVFETFLANFFTPKQEARAAIQPQLRKLRASMGGVGGALRTGVPAKS